MNEFDYIIVGAGSAGCVLVNRLGGDGGHHVLLIEAGPPDNNPFIRMPKGLGMLLSNTNLTWQFGTEQGPDAEPETWIRGRTLGGTSSINGMVYLRGQPQDYDDWERLGATGWNWSTMSRSFRAIEDHEFGESETRGAGGPMHVSVSKDPGKFAQLMLAAGEQMGMRRKLDINAPDQEEGIGCLARTIKGGRRYSAAEAFLAPARRRGNLVVMTGCEVQKILFESRQAVGVACLSNNGPISFRARREVIVSAGTVLSPKLLQVSGIGPAPHLREQGIPVVVDSPGVGENLCEQRLCTMQFRLADPSLSENSLYSPLRVLANTLRYALLRNGPFSVLPYNVCAFARSDPSLARPDIELVFAPYSMGRSPGELHTGRPTFEKHPGMQIIGHVLRPESRGRILTKSADFRGPISIVPNYLSTESDCEANLRLFDYMRRFARLPMLDSKVIEETLPGAVVETREEILDFIRNRGQPGFHAVGTCRMGEDSAAVVTPALKVRGVEGLRVVDCSVMPAMISGHTNAPAMALAWRAADIILGRT